MPRGRFVLVLFSPRPYLRGMKPDLARKLAILSDAAKYDASCASSGTSKRDSRKGGLGSTEGAGICHAYTPDGRCISLLKILMTNFCIFDCAYCVNRVSSNVERARFSVEEVVSLTLEFYRRNYIEGLFLSSGIIRSPDQTMADMVRIARTLRQDHGFKGYIHLKTIPDASPELIDEAGLYADRLSINIELPTDAGIADFAPEKQPGQIRRRADRLRIRHGHGDAVHAGVDGGAHEVGLVRRLRVGGVAQLDVVLLRRVLRACANEIPEGIAGGSVADHRDGVARSIHASPAGSVARGIAWAASGGRAGGQSNERKQDRQRDDCAQDGSRAHGLHGVT